MIGKFFCAIAKAFGGCKPETPQPADIGEVEGSSPRTKTHTPSPAYLKGKMPTYNVTDLIEHLEFRASIHLTYAKLLEDGHTEYLSFGSIDFHYWAIEGYSNAIFYLRRLS